MAVALLLSAGRADSQAAVPDQPATRLDTAALTTIRGENARLSARVDSLTDSLGKHRFAENFIGTALEQQSALYGVMVTVALAIFAALTFAGFRSEVRRLERELRYALEAQKEEAAGVEARLAKAEAFMRRMAGNTYVAIASVYTQTAPGQAVAAWLLAAGNFYAAQPETDRRSELGEANLAYALRTLKSIRAQDRQKVAGELARGAALRQEAFDLLRRCGDRAMDDLVAEIRVLIQQLNPDAAGASREGGVPTPGKPGSLS